MELKNWFQSSFAEHSQVLHPDSKLLVCPSAHSDFCPHWVSIVRIKLYTNLNLVLQLWFYSQYHLISSHRMMVHKIKFRPIAIKCHRMISWQKKSNILKHWFLFTKEKKIFSPVMNERFKCEWTRENMYALNISVTTDLLIWT